MSAALWGLRAGLERLVPRRPPTSSTLFWVLYTGALFLVFLALTFPHDLVARRVAESLAQGTRWRVDYDTVTLVPWRGYRFRNLRLAPLDGGADPWWSADVASLRPTFSALLRRSVFPLAFQGSAYGGTLSGTYERGREVGIDLSWESLSLARYPQLVRLVDGSWNGDLSGVLTLTGADALAALEGRSKLLLKNAALTGGKVKGFTVPDLHFATGTAELEIKKGGRLEVKSLKLSGSELDADVRGDVYLREPIEQSVVNGTIDLKPIPGAPGGIEGLLLLLNRNRKPQNNLYSLKLSGSLAQPRLR